MLNNPEIKIFIFNKYHCKTALFWCTNTNATGSCSGRLFQFLYSNFNHIGKAGYLNSYFEFLRFS